MRSSPLMDPASNYLVDFRSLYQAWQSCQKRKAGTAAAQRYEMHLLDNLWATLQCLQSAKYQTTASYAFVTTQPKLREIHAAHFTDRVVHHYLVPKLEKLWEPWFIFDVYSNRKNKGTHKAIKRCQSFMRKADALFYVQLDIHNFFYSIHQPTLLNLFQKGLKKAIKQNKITQQEARFYSDLIHTFVQADYSRATDISPHLSHKVPSHKRLSQQPKDYGLPIGNLTSQFFANVYLNALDQFIKHQLKCTYYIRFVDDFILMADSEQALTNWLNEIEWFLANQLSLKLKPQYSLRSVTQGANFLGYIVRPFYILVRQRVVGHLKVKLTQFAQSLIERQADTVILSLDPAKLNRLRATLASYLGHFKHAHSLALIQNLWHAYDWLDFLFKFNPQTYQLHPKVSPAKSSNFRQQLAFFRQAYPQAKLKIQFGQQTQVYLPELGAWQYTVVIHQKGENQRGNQHRQATRIVLQSHSLKYFAKELI